VDLTSVGNVGAGNGNQVYAPISLPIDVCGNAIAIVGTSQAQCEGGASVESGDSHYGYRSAGDRSHGNGYGDGADLTSAGNVGAVGRRHPADPDQLPTLHASVLRAVVLQPLQGDSGARPADQDFTDGARELCREDGPLERFDHGQTVQQRTAELVAYMHYAFT